MKRHSHSLYTAASFSVSSFYSRHLTRSPRLTINKHPAFTIVELLIVIVIIGILAAITVVAYRGITNRANASVASQALSEAKRKLLLYQVDNTTWPTTLSAADIKESNNLTYQYSYNNTTTPATYCLTATVKNTSYKLDSTSQTPTAGGCAGHGQGGNAAITNLATNPKVKNNTNGWNVTSSTGGNLTGSRLTNQTSPIAGVDTLYRVTVNTSPSSWWRSQISSFPVIAEQSYTLGAWIRTNVAIGTSVIIIWGNSSGSYITESGASAGQNANTWQFMSVTAIAPTGASQARLQFGGTGTVAVGSYLDTTGVMFEQSSTSHNFSDGDSTNWLWNGTPNNSTSTGPAQ